MVWDTFIYLTFFHHTQNGLPGQYFRMWGSNMSIVITALYNTCRPNYDHPASAHAQNPPSLFPVKSISSSEICVVSQPRATSQLCGITRASIISPSGDLTMAHVASFTRPLPVSFWGGSFSLAESGIKTRTWNIFGIACSRAATEAFLKY